MFYELSFSQRDSIRLDLFKDRVKEFYHVCTQVFKIQVAHAYLSLMVFVKSVKNAFNYFLLSAFKNSNRMSINIWIIISIFCKFCASSLLMFLVVFSSFI